MANPHPSAYRLVDAGFRARTSAMAGVGWREPSKGIPMGVVRTDGGEAHPVREPDALRVRTQVRR
jgi:hypothetical protein